MSEPEDCPTAEEVAALVEGAPLDGGWQHVHAHLIHCSTCRAVLAEARKLRLESRSEEDTDNGS